MTKKSLIFLILLILTTVLTGCGNQQANQKTDQVNKDGARRPDFGQPEEKAEIKGLVKSILGNEVTIIKFERQNRDNSTKAGEALNDVKNAQKPSGQMNLGGGQRMPGMGSGPGVNKGDMDEESRTVMLQKIKEMSTGEEKVIIPVGIKMIKTSFVDGKAESVEATLSDVKADSMLQVWLNTDVVDKKIASFVLISS